MTGLWSRHAQSIDQDHFRAPGQYLSEPADYPYFDLVRWCRREHPNLLDTFTEDGAFGCAVAVAAEGKTVSRDLLDSVVEIGFLEKHLIGLRCARVLGIGAGYGRFAHRLTAAYPAAFVYCTDAHPVSSLCCERYLAHRGVTRALVADQRELVDHVSEPIDLAVNIHSWSECTVAEVEWWLEWLQAQRVQHIFCVPHTPDFGTWTDNGAVGPSFLPIIHSHGYVLTRHWRGPDCWARDLCLFERAE
jgi:putative sugar O-methyltransferase